MMEVVFFPKYFSEIGTTQDIKKLIQIANLFYEMTI